MQHTSQPVQAKHDNAVGTVAAFLAHARRARTIAAALVLFVLPSLAAAAGFDCSKAASAVERRLCADPTLSRMDHEMSEAYAHLLATTQDADAWKADQRAWLAERNRCHDDSCLRYEYSERTTVLRAGGRSFRWNGNWWRVDADGNAPSKLVISQLGKRGFAFDLSASAGADTGELSGKASLVTSDAARYRGDDASDTEGCELTFRRVLNRLQVEQKGDSATCGAGLNVTYGGTYVAAEHDPNVAPDLVTRSVLPSAELDKAFRAMVGDDYPKFVDAADVAGTPDHATLNGKPVSVVGMFVRGIACDSHASIAYDEHGHLWAALLYLIDENKSEVRYYTNVASDKRELPKLFASERKDCRSDAVPVRIMP